MQIIIDRFEDEAVVAEYEDASGNIRLARIDKALIPDAKEGDVVEIYINSCETNKRKEKIKKLMDELFE